MRQGRHPMDCWPLVATSENDLGGRKSGVKTRPQDFFGRVLCKIKLLPPRPLEPSGVASKKGPGSRALASRFRAEER